MCIRDSAMAVYNTAGLNCCVVDCHCTSHKCRGLFMESQRKVNSKIVMFTIPNREFILCTKIYDISNFGSYFLGVSEEQDEWRSKMIAAINRCDTSFNPDTHKICSRHFEDNCFSGGNASEFRRHKTLKFGSLPTLFMPKNL